MHDSAANDAEGVRKNIGTVLQSVPASERTFFLRYAGEVAFPGRPIDRLLDDMATKKAGVLVAVLEVLNRLFPEVIDAAQVHTIVNANRSLDTAYGMHRTNTDLTERSIIEYFDHNTLLNRQHGGFWSDYVPREDDVEAFKSQDASVYYPLSEQASLPPISMRNDVTQHFIDVQAFANNNAGTGTARHPFTDAFRQVTTEQAMPVLYKGKASIIAIIGKDITYDNYVRELSFFKGKSQAATMWRDILVQFAKMESEYIEGVVSFHSQAFSTLIYPFVDLWNWLWHWPESQEQAAAFLCRYLSRTRPIITATMSREVNGFTLCNFNDSVGVQGKALLDLVGQPTIQYCDEDTTSGGSYNPDLAFINVPHIHPGSDKYTAHQTELRRVAFLAWAKTQVIASIAMRQIDAIVAKDQPFPTRLALCQSVLAELANLAANDRGFMDLEQRLLQAKQDLKVKKATRNGGDDVRPFLNQDGRVRLAALGKTRGEPNSGERRDFLNLMWERNIPDLHLTISHNNENKGSWIQMFIDLPAEHYMFLRVLADLPAEDDYVKHLIRTIRPEWKDDDSWMQATDKRKEAEVACALWFQKKPVAEAEKGVGKGKTHLVAFPDDYATATDLQGRPVGVGSTGAIRMRYKKNNTEQVIVQIRVKSAIPEDGERFSPRFVQFTAEGIDIVDAEGTPFRQATAAGKVMPATIPKVKLAGTEGGAATLELWKAVCAAHNISIADENELTAVPPKDWSHAPKGIGLISNNKTSEDPRQNRPPKEGDAHHPLYIWLNDRFPEGGELDTIGTNLYPASKDDLQHFKDFLGSPDWINHPYVSESWLPKLSGVKPEVGMLEKNIRIHRSTVSERRTVGNIQDDGSGKRVQVRQRVIIVGAPGSASDNPFPAKATAASKAKAKEAGGGADEPSTSKKGASKKAPPKKTPAKSAPDSDEDDDPPTKKPASRKTPAKPSLDDSEEDDNPPTKKAASKKKAAPRKTAKKAAVAEPDDTAAAYPTTFAEMAAASSKRPAAAMDDDEEESGYALGGSKRTKVGTGAAGTQQRPTAEPRRSLRRSTRAGLPQAPGPTNFDGAADVDIENVPVVEDEEVDINGKC